MIKLIGIAVVALGFALRFNTLLVVMAAGIATGLVAGMSLNDIMSLFGKYFVENRYMTLPVVLMVPLIGLLERYGLQERAEVLIKRARSATAGRVILLYTAVRQISVALGINVGGSGGAHASFVRPLVAPLAEGAARAQHHAGPGLRQLHGELRANPGRSARNQRGAPGQIKCRHVRSPQASQKRPAAPRSTIRPAAPTGCAAPEVKNASRSPSLVSTCASVRWPCAPRATTTPDVGSPALS